MIISRLRGGLGNQLFQYAAGRSLALRHHTDLYLDLTDFAKPSSRSTYRPFELKEFNLRAAIATQNETKIVLGENPHTAWFSLKAKADLMPHSYAREPYFHYWPMFETITDNVYLDGYWQSERYFAQIQESLRQELKLVKLLSASAQAEQARIQNSRAVSLHVRRGDYLSASSANRFLRSCPTDYYYRAVAYLTERLGHSFTLFVFSDDLPWAKNNLRFSQETHFIENNTPAEDLHLMAACQHHIMANSTFSWWGAWLNPSPDKMVVAPQQWFSKGSFDTRDLLPFGWVKW